MDLRRVAAAAAIAALAAAAGCRTAEEKLVDRRREQRAVLDRLYSGYGGTVPPKEEASSAGFVDRLLSVADRPMFEQQCLAGGRGERPFALSAKLDEFLRRPDVQRDCRRSADLQLEIDALERQAATSSG